MFVKNQLDFSLDTNMLYRNLIKNLIDEELNIEIEKQNFINKSNFTMQKLFKTLDIVI
jgi:hypothetical protein